MNHKGKCRFPHGHNYELDVTVTAPLNDQGMVLDFSDIKGKVKQMLEKFDHAFVLYSGDPLVYIFRSEQITTENQKPDKEYLRLGVPTKVVVIDQHPTAEVISRLFKRQLRDWLGSTVGLKVTVYETRDCCATADPDYGADFPEIKEVW